MEGKDVEDLKHLKRFLLTGATNGVCCTNDAELDKDSSDIITRLISSGYGLRVIAEIVNSANASGSSKRNSVVFALASCARSTDLQSKQLAYKSLSKVCQSPEDLFLFLSYSQIFNCTGTTSTSVAMENHPTKKPRPSWGRAQRNAVTDWYCSHSPHSLAEVVTRVRQRHGWTHQDLMRLTHMKTSNQAISTVLKYIVRGITETKAAIEAGGDSEDDVKDVLSYLDAVETMKHSTDFEQVTRLIEEHKLTNEHVPNMMLKHGEVWGALIHTMPLSWLLCNLCKLTTYQLLSPSSGTGQKALERLQEDAAIKQAKLHPLTVQVCWRAYEQCCLQKGRMKWIPEPAIQDALDITYRSSFKNLTATNKKFLVAININKGSALRCIDGVPAIAPSVIVATMVSVLAHIERTYAVLSFTSEVQPVVINQDMAYQDVAKALAEAATKVVTGKIDLTAPVKWALNGKKNADIFVIYTDAQKCLSSTTLVDAFKEYRETINTNAKLIICGLSRSIVPLGDTSEICVLHISCFNSTSPDIMHRFIMSDL